MLKYFALRDFCAGLFLSRCHFVFVHVLGFVCVDVWGEGGARGAGVVQE